MATQPYVQALEAARFIMGPPAIKGVPLWRGPGIDAVRLLVERFAELVRTRHPVRVVEHSFLASQADNRRVFGNYTDDVYELVDVPGNPDALFRSDNIVSSLARLDREGSEDPLIAVGTVMRHFPGRTPPLFRDRQVWPVVELNHLVPQASSVDALDFYRSVIAELLWGIAVPSVTVCTDELAGYGRTTYLVVTALPNRRPTVLATLYVLSDELKGALGQDRDVIDVGFTGKVLATAAMVHADARGLMLAGRIAPVELGITVGPRTDLSRHARWLTALQEAGLRYEVVRAADGSRSRARAEKAWHRAGVPLVLGLDREPGSVVLCSRLPRTRVALAGLPDPHTVRQHLNAHDNRLRASASRLMTDTNDRGGHLRTLCRRCAHDLGAAVFGHVVPMRRGACQTCGDPAGVRRFISAEGRFY